MKQLIVLIFLVFTFVCNGQITDSKIREVNYKDIFESKGVIFFKADTTLVSGRVIRYNKKNVEKRYIFVKKGKPDDLGWIKVNNVKSKEPVDNPLVDLLAHTVLQNTARKSAINNGMLDSEGDFVKYNKNKYREAYRTSRKSNEISKNFSPNENVKIETVEEDQIDININGVFETYHYNGKLANKGYYVDGMKDGIWKEYYDNSQLKSKGSYNRNHKDGLWEEYYSNGQLKSKGRYLKGKYIAGWVYFDEAGKKLLLEYHN